MDYKVNNRFKGNINGVEFDDEQSYDYLKEFIEDLEDKFNLEINDKTATEFLQNQLYEETECFYNTTDDYEEAHYNAMDNLFDNIELIKGVMRYEKY